jgi:hypothetical protein
MTNGNITKKQAAGLGALAATAVTAGATAVGYYFYASKDAVKHRKIAAKWASSLKDDVIKQARKMKAFDKKMLTAVITEASKKYAAMNAIDKKDVAQAVKELRANWQNVAAEIQRGAKKTAKIVNKTAHKMVKQTVKKTVTKRATK